MIGIGNKNGSGFPSLGCINKPAFGSGILPEPPHGRGGRVYNADNPACQHIISKANIDDSFLAHGSFQILHLFTAFFQFIFEVHHNGGKLGIRKFIAQSIHFPETFLESKVQFASRLFAMVQ